MLALTDHALTCLTTNLAPRWCQPAVRLLADYDLARAKLLRPAVLDQRWRTKPGYAVKLLRALEECGLLQVSQRGRAGSGAGAVWQAQLTASCVPGRQVVQAEQEIAGEADARAGLVSEPVG